MNTTMTAHLAEPPSPTPHRYQIYRQSRNGLHYSHGPIIDNPAEAVAQFLQTAPAFEGGGLRLWDHYGQQKVASAEWTVETTRMGFAVRTRANVFHDPLIAIFAARIAEHERLEQTITDRLRMAV